MSSNDSSLLFALRAPHTELRELFQNRPKIMTSLVALAYCSRPTKFSFEQIDEILKSARQKNERDAITGALIYDNKTFLQWIEGDASLVRAAFDRICADPRHTEIKLLTVQKLTGRWFPDWSMTAAITQDQTLRGLKLVPHLSLAQFDPLGWSDADTICFMEALSDYLTRRPAPTSEKLQDDPVSPRMMRQDPVASLDRRLNQVLHT